MDFNLEENILTDEFCYYFSLLTDRFAPLNNLWSAELEKQFGKKFKPINILAFKHNDIFIEPNYIVLNKDIAELRIESGRSDIINLIYPEELNKQFANSNVIKELTEKLIQKQGEVYVLSFSSVWLDISNPKVKILGPSPEVAARFDDKVAHIKTFETLKLPVNEYRIYNNIEDLKAKHFTFPFFISATFSSGGIESKAIYTPEDLEVFYANLRPVNKHEPIISHKLIDNIALAPNITALVSDDSVINILITDQILRNNNYMGNIYPSQVRPHYLDTIKQTTIIVGEFLQKQGFRGLFGMDYLITEDGKCYPVDINPRRQGGYYCIVMSSPINIIELELNTILGKKIPSINFDDFQCDYCWAHSKLTPYYSNVRILDEYCVNEPNKPFEKIGSVHKAIYYPKDHTIILGNPGFYLKTARTRKELLRGLYADIEKTISTTYGMYE